MQPAVPGFISDDGQLPFGQCAPTAMQRALIALAGHTVLGRGRSRWLISSLIETLRPGPIDVERLGLKLRLHHYGGNYSEKKMLLHAHHYDEHELAHILRHVHPQFHFADVGAHTGFYSFAVKARCPGARIAAFEPIATYCRRMEFNVQVNGLRDFSVIEAAVGSERGAGQLFLDRGALSGEGPSLAVEVVPLCETLQEKGFTRLDALKIDVEGFEDRILFPFFERAPRDLQPATIVIEHAFQSHWQRDCRELLSGLSYRAAWHGALNTVYERAT